MVLISDGTSEKGARVRNNLGNMIWLSNLFRSRAVTNVFKQRHIFLYKLPSNISNIIVLPVFKTYVGF